MFEARLLQGSILKKLMDSITGLLTDANFDCSSSGITLQAMDSAHVSLVALFLRADGFHHYRCDRNISLGINLGSLSKILKCAGSEDIITLKAEDSAENVTFMFESPKQTRVSHFALKLMDIDSEHLGIPETEYQCVVQMPGPEFQRICREIAIIGDTVKITASKEGVKFQVIGDQGTGSIVCKSNPSVDDATEAVVVKCEDEVSLTFALRYLNFFAKATPLSGSVILKMSPDVPLVTEYKVGENGALGYVRFYLAPKIDEEEAGGEGGGGASANPEMAEE
jgi:proliferating cell nuclear antigen